MMQDGRPFVVGLSDDAGGGNILGLSAANLYAPEPSQLHRIDEYVAHTLLGKKSHPGLANWTFSLQDPESLRIRMTVFYYYYTPDYHTALQTNFPNASAYYEELDKCTIGPSWCAFNAVSNQTKPDWHPRDYRQYNFPHQIAAYLALYSAARECDLLSPPLSQHFSWYLEMAARTLLALGCCEDVGGRHNCRCYPTVGLMDGTVFREVLLALWAEAEAVEAEADQTAAEVAMMPNWRSYASLVDYMMRLRVFGPEATEAESAKVKSAEAEAANQPAKVKPTEAETVEPVATKALDPFTVEPDGAKNAEVPHLARARVPWVEQDAPYGSEFNCTPALPLCSSTTLTRCAAPAALLAVCTMSTSIAHRNVWTPLPASAAQGIRPARRR